MKKTIVKINADFVETNNLKIIFTGNDFFHRSKDSHKCSLSGMIGIGDIKAEIKISNIKTSEEDARDLMEVLRSYTKSLRLDLKISIIDHRKTQESFIKFMRKIGDVIEIINRFEEDNK